MPQPVFRFAPSPNGRLHLGHAYSALLNERLAREAGGRLLLRIEDTDLTRARPEFEQAIRDDLAWLGIAFDGEVRRQSEHFDVYAEARDRLRGMGLLYPCACTRGGIAAASGPGGARDPDGAPIYPGTCKARPADERQQLLARGDVAERIDMAAALKACPGPSRFAALGEAGAAFERTAQPGRWGDAAIVRKGTPTSYHLSCVIDDALQGVTHVARGADMEAATDLHALLQRLFGLPTPIYRFHRLILDADGKKLAKSRGSASLADLREAGVTAADVRRQLGFASS